MTVCIAAIFQWNYGAADGSSKYGAALMAVSDRMITAGDIQYEPGQTKVAYVTDDIVIMVAGDYDVHSEAIKVILEQARRQRPTRPFDVAIMYGNQIQAIQRRHAESIYLAPLGLNTDSFIAQQKDMSDSFVDMLRSQLQSHEGSDVEALVVGMEGTHAHIYQVDKRGTVRCFDDVGFAAIGIGAWHARSRLTEARYVNQLYLSPAVTAIFDAKKAAEVAPGVGKETDIILVTRGRAHPLWEDVKDKLEEVAREATVIRERLLLNMANRISEHLHEAGTKQKSPEDKQQSQAPNGIVDGKPSGETA